MNVGGLGRSTGSCPVARVIAACTSVAAASRLLFKIKLQHEAGVALAAVGRHHLQAGNLHELALERRGHVVGHGLRRRARIIHLHLNHGIVDRGQIVDRQAQVREHAKQDDRDRQDHRHHRASDEWFGEIHDAPFCELLPLPLPAGAAVSMRTLPPGRTSS